MSFVRVKTIASKPYGYLVENYWTSSGSRQRIKKYLGRVLILPRLVNPPYAPPSKEYSALINYLLARELTAHGLHAPDFTKEHLRIDLTKRTVTNNTKPVVIQCNEGFLCHETISLLHDFVPTSEQCQLDLARTLIESGINIPPEHFLDVYEAAIARLHHQPNK